MWSGIIPAGSIPRFLAPDNNLLTNKRNLIKFGYIVELITLFMVKKTLVWSLRYDPTQHFLKKIKGSKETFKKIELKLYAFVMHLS